MATDPRTSHTPAALLRGYSECLYSLTLGEDSGRPFCHTRPGRPAMICLFSCFFFSSGIPPNANRHEALRNCSSCATWPAQA